MIDGIRGRKRNYVTLHPRDKEYTNQMVVGDHSKDAHQQPSHIQPLPAANLHHPAAVASRPQPDTASLHESAFHPPQEVAAMDDSAPQAPLEQDNRTFGLPASQPSHHRRSVKQWWHDASKKQKIIFSSGGAVLVAALAVTSFFVFFKSPPPPPKAKVVSTPVVKPAPPAPTTVPSDLTGLPVSPDVNDRPVTGIMIENSLDARPQSGLNQAGVVFEAVAEGGITRFLTLFQDTAPDYIGPVRSVRPYYIQWAMGFDAAIAHVGGSAEGLADMTNWHVKNLDQFYGAAYFWRISQRYAPHNMYTSMAKLNAYEAAKGYGKPNFTPLERKAASPLATPTVKSINFTLSNYYYNVHYDYNAATNSYNRSEGGAPHVDQQSGAQLSPKVVVALIMQNGLSGEYNTYATIGSGKAYVFQDGGLTTGTWHKASNSANFTFTDDNGAPLKLDPGQVWFTALGSTGDVAYAP